jgi:hypothetical protein
MNQDTVAVKSLNHLFIHLTGTVSRPDVRETSRAAANMKSCLATFFQNQVLLYQLVPLCQSSGMRKFSLKDGAESEHCSFWHLLLCSQART